MESAVAMVFSLLVGLLSMVAPVLVIAAIVYFVVRRKNGNGIITTYRVLLAYFHLVTAASVVIMAVGAGYLAFAGFSLVYGGRSPIDDELTLGLALLGTGALVCVLHVLGRRAVEKPQEPATRLLKRTYLFFMLAIFSLAGLVALPSALNDVVWYYIEGYRRGSNPTTSLATAVVTVPLWGYYLWRILREFRHGQGDASPAA